MTVTVKTVRLPHGRDLPLPAYESEGAAGLDLRAAIDAPITLDPRQRALVPTGLVFELPAGHEAQVRPRSGLAAKHGVTVLNTPGTIDSDYRGEIKVILVNLGDKPFEIEPAARIAQIVIAPATRATLVAVDSVAESDRGSGGFGSTGRS